MCVFSSMSVISHTHAVYINHRPAFGLSPSDLIRAFSALGTGGEGVGCTADRGTLLAMLQEHGTFHEYILPLSLKVAAFSPEKMSCLR